MDTPRILLCTGLLFLCVQSLPQSTSRLSDMISHYEPVHYDRVAFHQSHHRTKRSTDSTLHLNIKAFGQNFNIRLRRDVNSISQDVQLETSKGSVHLNPDFAYSGHLEGVPHSSVFGVVTSEGLFEGTIRTPTTVYRLEGSSRYDLDGTKREEFHSIMYRDEDIDYHKLKTPSSCQSDALHRKVKENLLLKKAKDEAATDKIPQNKDNKETTDNEIPNKNAKESPKVDIPLDHINDEKSKYFKKPNHHSRTKRAVDPTKTQCTLYIQIDHRYYNYWKTEEAVVQQISQHVQAVNDIYKLIDFDTNGSPEGITFIVKKIKIWTDPTDRDYRFPSNYAVETFLTMYSDNSNFDDFCLSYIFTYRDFDGGTLGLAWTGSTTSAGGLCERMGTFSGTQKALNAGLISILNYGQFQPQLISFVTFAHEIGHNFGSEHDQDSSAACAPGGTPGNFIMYPKATDGNKPNNNKFSTCSISNMFPVVSQKAMDGVNGCFQVPEITICGNGLVEAGEVCDCGYSDSCTDECCNPQVLTGQASNGTACTLKGAAQCSPSQGSCCSAGCTLVAENTNTTCREATGCIAAATCNGNLLCPPSLKASDITQCSPARVCLGGVITGNATCPSSPKAADLTTCSSSRVCLDGACTGSLCLIYNMIECQCSPAVSGNFSDPILCQLCCKPNSTDPAAGNCTSSYSLTNMPNTQVDSGTVCNNFEGYCDVFKKCRPVVPDGVLSQILDLNTLKDWLQNNWYFPVAGAVGFIILMIIMIKVCTPKKKSDKNKKDKDKNKKSKVSPKKGPARRDQALTPPKAKPYKVYDSNNPPPNGYPGANGYDPYAGGQPYPGQMPPGAVQPPYGGQMPPGATMPYGAAPYGANPYG